MRSRTPGPVSPSSENGRAAYHVPSACQTSRPIMFAKHTRSASRPLPPSRVCTSRSVGHNNNKCCPRSSLEIVPCGNSVSRAEHTAATPHCAFVSHRSMTSSSTNSFFGNSWCAPSGPPLLPRRGCRRTSPTCCKTLASLANHPTVSRLFANFITPVALTAPCVGRNPNTPQCAAGILTDPPESVPSAKSHLSTAAATATAEPLDDPPGTRPGEAGLIGAP
mmetsp:Transcript_8936/g.33329  ORF Transcript_8936/g.33329 Transcript_8936/m.33329 type:complete len:221 (-) Transcript_8936:416-1078(-)